MKILRSIAVITCFLVSQNSSADYLWGFGDLSLNYLDWGDGTENKAAFKRDFSYVELEGGAQYDWGDLYGFFDLEKWDKSGNEQRTASKGIVHYYLGKTPFSLYGHVYSFSMNGFSDQNRVLGFGYRIMNKNFFFKPFIGYHSAVGSIYTGRNGFMAGWFMMYFFNLFEEQWRAVSWHESEYDRNENYAAGNGNENNSINGAVSLWWLTTDKINLGLQYRYARDKLGTAGYMNAMIFTLRYNLY